MLLHHPAKGPHRSGSRATGSCSIPSDAKPTQNCRTLRETAASVSLYNADHGKKLPLNYVTFNKLGIDNDDSGVQSARHPRGSGAEAAGASAGTAITAKLGQVTNAR